MRETSLPRQPAAHPFLHRGGQSGPIVSIAALAERFGLRRVRVNDRSQFAQPDASRHRHTDFADHLAGMARNDGCSENFIVPFADVEFHKTTLTIFFANALLARRVTNTVTVTVASSPAPYKTHSPVVRWRWPAPTLTSEPR